MQPSPSKPLPLPPILECLSIDWEREAPVANQPKYVPKDQYSRNPNEEDLSSVQMTESLGQFYVVLGSFKLISFQ